MFRFGFKIAIKKLLGKEGVCYPENIKQISKFSSKNNVLFIILQHYNNTSRYKYQK